MTHQKFEQNPHNNFLDLNLRVSSWGTKNRLTRFWDLVLNLKEITSLWLQILHSTTTVHLVGVGCTNSRVFCFCPRNNGYFKDLLTRAQLCGSDWIAHFFFPESPTWWPALDIQWDSIYFLSPSCSVSAPLFHSILSLHLWSSCNFASRLHLKTSGLQFWM